MAERKKGMLDKKIKVQDSISSEIIGSRPDVTYLPEDYWNSGRKAQIWIFPNEEGLNPLYTQADFPWEERINKWFLMVSSHEGKAPVKLYQDVEIYALYLEKGKKVSFPIKGTKNSFYLAVLEGNGKINGIPVNEKEDAYGDESFELEAEHNDMHVLLFIV